MPFTLEQSSIDFAVKNGFVDRGSTKAYRDCFDRLYTCIESGDREGMREMMRLSTMRRQLFGKKK